MKKTFLSVGFCVLFLLFSGCIHGSLDISIPDGITTRMSGDQTYTYCFHSEEGYYDTISGTFTATKDSQSTTYTATYACLAYTIEDSESVKKNYRSYSFLVGGTDGDGCYKEFLSGEIYKESINYFVTTSLVADYSIVTHSGQYGYDEYRQKEFDLNIFHEAGHQESKKEDPDEYTIQFNCHFKRTSD